VTRIASRRGVRCLCDGVIERPRCGVGEGYATVCVLVVRSECKMISLEVLRKPRGWALGQLEQQQHQTIACWWYLNPMPEPEPVPVPVANPGGGRRGKLAAIKRLIDVGVGGKCLGEEVVDEVHLFGST